MRDDLLLALVLVFVPFSLMSIGGGSAIIAGVQHETVAARGWLSSHEFIEFFAICRAAPPGPGTMLATLIGWKVAGWAGAAIATLALFVPSSLLTFAVVRAGRAHRGACWRRLLHEDLAPVGIGLVLAGVITLFRLSGGGLLSGGVALLAAAVFLFRPQIPALAVLAAGGLAWMALDRV